MPRILYAVLLAAAATAISAPQAHAVQIVSSSMGVSALHPRISTTSASDSTTVAQLPFQDSIQAVRGSARSTASYDFFSIGDTTTFDVQFAIRIPESYGPANYHGQARSTGNIVISLPDGGNYDVRGLFVATGIMPQVDLRIQIRDTATNAYVFHSNRRSTGPNNVAREIDPASPTGASTWIGSPSGVLPAGSYRLTYDLFASNGFTPNALGDVVGDLSIEIETVPEPSTFAMAGLGVLGMLIIQRTRRKTNG